MYFENEKYDCTTRTFSGEINYAPDTLKGVSRAFFEFTFSKKFSFIASGHKTTDIDRESKVLFGKKENFRYRKYV